MTDGAYHKIQKTVNRIIDFCGTSEEEEKEEEDEDEEQRQAGP